MSDIQAVKGLIYYRVVSHTGHMYHSLLKYGLRISFKIQQTKYLFDNGLVSQTNNHLVKWSPQGYFSFYALEEEPFIYSSLTILDLFCEYQPRCQFEIPTDFCS